MSAFQPVADVVLPDLDQVAFAQLVRDRIQLGLVELLGEQRIDGVLKSLHLARPRVASLAQVLDDGIYLFVAARGIRDPEFRYLREIGLAADSYLLPVPSPSACIGTTT